MNKNFEEQVRERARKDFEAYSHALSCSIKQGVERMVSNITEKKAETVEGDTTKCVMN